MSKIWVEFTFMLLAALLGLGLLHPMRRSRKLGLDPHAVQAAVYRDQLAELERDRALGLFSDDEAEYARAEIARRLLSIPKETDEPPFNPHFRRFSNGFLALLLAGSFVLYLLIGRPDSMSSSTPGQRGAGANVDSFVTQAEETIAQNPDDGRTWDILAPVYFRSGRLAQAQQAYRNSIRLLGPSEARLNGLAETIIAAGGGTVTDEATRVLQQSLQLEPTSPRVRFFLALGLEQAGKRDDAKAAFEGVLENSPSDAPWIPIVHQHIAEDSVPSLKPTSVLTGFSSSTEEMQRIRTMVKTLDASLAANPVNYDGWVQLIRSYIVLSDKDCAAAAVQRALQAFPADSEQGHRLIDIARALHVPIR